ncbi:septal ring lytic transglycosylase RlpA family protein [Pacificimonas aurantium]|uniref:Endolytic peptidoglycan transglycosylase RlpA n=1 Tax=Pacificimonas aurantium TaxID=1250540 RepID=A0ABS7WKW6_9SPHN|nr:septal ring lytic transglycosylase RlpA family protein [Pacificimonas aurantium]
MALLGLSGCGGGSGYEAGLAGASQNAPAGVKIGKPYKIRGTWYYPEDDPSYRETGTASWYGPNFHGKPTANGERFDQNALTAAHRTLPMPSWVRVENLDNGREVTVRVNDRGPFAHNRIIDLSRRAAQLLDMQAAGVARVRVTRVYPGAAEPPRRRVPEPVIAGRGDLFIQIAALSQQARARDLAASLGDYGPAALVDGPSGLVRVRLGPFAERSDAERMLARVRRGGYPEARIVSDPLS